MVVSYLTGTWLWTCVRRGSGCSARFSVSLRTSPVVSFLLALSPTQSWAFLVFSSARAPSSSPTIPKTHPGGELLFPLRSPSDEELLRDAEAGGSALAHYMDASWWKWKRGSRLHFWRWPNHVGRSSARDGFPVFVVKPLPRKSSKQRPPLEELRKWIAEKVCDVQRKEYIAEGTTISYIDFFAVPKTVDANGEVTEIRMVYNGTSCGLNDCVWAPNF